MQCSFKESTHAKRGKGVQRKVSGSTKTPNNWMNSLCDQMNKKELFAFLKSRIELFNWPSSKSVYVRSGQAVSACGLSLPMDNCNHDKDHGPHTACFREGSREHTCSNC